MESLKIGVSPNGGPAVFQGNRLGTPTTKETPHILSETNHMPQTTGECGR